MQEMNKPRFVDIERYHLLLLGGLALAVRLVALWTIDIPIVAWRPTELASIALNYYRGGFHFLNPQINWGGNGPGYVEMEFPLIPFRTACLYEVFGVHDWVALVIPVLSGIGTVLVTYSLTRLLLGSTAAFVAGIFTAVSPTLLGLSISIWPDPPMVFCCSVGILGLVKWVKSDRLVDFLTAGITAGMAILLKVTALFIGSPILFLCICKYGSRWWKTSMVWILGVLILGPSMLWYWHAHNLYLNYHNTFGIFSAGYLKFGTIEILMNPDFYEHLAFRIAVYHVSPIVFVLLIYGATILQQNRLSYVFHIWLLGVLIYFLIAARGVFIGHYQYVLPIVPAATPLAALGAVRLVKKLSSGSYGKRKNSEKTIFLLGTAIYCLTITASIVLYFSHAIASESGWQNDRMTGLMVSRVTMPGALIVVVDNQMDELKPETSMTPPNVFYFSDRKGWYQSMAWLSPNRIEELRSLGAKYLVITENSVSIFEKDFSSLRSYLNNHFNKSIASNEGIVFDLGYEHR